MSNGVRKEPFAWLLMRDEPGEDGDQHLGVFKSIDAAKTWLSRYIKSDDVGYTAYCRLYECFDSGKTVLVGCVAVDHTYNEDDASCLTVSAYGVDNNVLADFARELNGHLV